MDIKKLLQFTVEAKASDLHLINGIPPTIRVNGELRIIPNETVLTPEAINALLKEILTTEQVDRLNVNKEIDFSFPFSNLARFRVNAYTQKSSSWGVPDPN